MCVYLVVNLNESIQYFVDIELDTKNIYKDQLETYQQLPTKQHYELHNSLKIDFK